MFTISRLTSYSWEYVKHTTEPLQVFISLMLFFIFVVSKMHTEAPQARSQCWVGYFLNAIGYRLLPPLLQM